MIEFYDKNCYGEIRPLKTVQAMKEVPTIAITGPAGCGKTTSLSYIPEKLLDWGYCPIVIPETATELFTAGVHIGEQALSPLKFQEHLLRAQIEKERRYRAIAENYASDKVILLCDRGTMDCAAYMPWEQFLALLESMGSNIVGARDASYNAVMLLEAAPKEFYQLANNSTRKETWEESVAQEELLKKIWAGQPHLRIITNSKDFRSKQRRLLAAICRVVGIPQPLEIERRFMVQSPDFKAILAACKGAMQKIFVEQIYLTEEEPEVVRRIRKRGQHGHFIYFETKKRRISGTTTLETEHTIDPLRYIQLAERARDYNRAAIRKDRYCFLWNNQYFELDIFHEPKRVGHLCILEIELTEENDAVEVPRFLSVVKEITGDIKFSNSELARIL